MEINCDIIRDILPLYAEELVSTATREMVEDHLCGCDSCTKQLGILKKAAQLPVEVDTDGLKRVSTAIRRQRVITVLAAVVTLLTMVVTGVIWMVTPVYLKVEEAIEGVELREDGGLAIDYASGIIGISGFATDENFQNWGIMCSTTRYDWLKARWNARKYENLHGEELEAYILDLYKQDTMTQSLWDRFHNIQVDYGTWILPNGKFLHTYDPEVWVEGNGEWAYRRSTINHWYLDLNTGMASTLIWQGIPGEQIQPPVHPRIETSYFYAVLTGLGVFLGMGFWFLSRRSNGRNGALALRFAILCGAFVVSVLLTTGGQLIIGQQWNSYKWPGYIAVETVFLTLTVLFWHLWHGNKGKMV